MQYPPPLRKPRSQARPSRKLWPRDWRPLARKATQLSPRPLPGCRPLPPLRCTCRAAPSAAPSGDNFLLPALGSGAAPAPRACSPRGPGAAQRPGPQPNLGPELFRGSWGQAPFSFQGHPRPLYPVQDPRSSYRHLHVPVRDCIRGPLPHTRPVLPEVCPGNSWDSSCR